MVVIILLWVSLWQFSFLLSPTPSICHRKFFLIADFRTKGSREDHHSSTFFLGHTILLSQFSAATE
jgi:hypothetical protein